MIRDAANELRAIAQAATDASGYFPALYSRVTGRIADSIDAGKFEAPERMDAFASTFAGYFTRAWHNQGQGDRPRCWQACWDVARDRSLLIVQHLFLGINAHVNHDLALATVDVARASGDLAGVRPDFDAVNDVLADVYVDVLRGLDMVSRFANEAAALGGGRAFNFSLRVARRQAWGGAERLYKLDEGSAAAAAYKAELDRLVSVLAYLITQPPAPARPLLWLARRLEEKDPAKVVAALI